MNAEEFYCNFFPEYRNLSIKVDNLKHSLSETEARQQQFERWAANARAVEVKFRMLQ